jgi:hypothetical protein
MDLIDIEISELEGFILIWTNDGELIQLQVAPRFESIVSAIFARPRASISIRGVAANDVLVETLCELGHDVRLQRLSETG